MSLWSLTWDSSTTIRSSKNFQPFSEIIYVSGYFSSNPFQLTTFIKQCPRRLDPTLIDLRIFDITPFKVWYSAWVVVKLKIKKSSLIFVQIWKLCIEIWFEGWTKRYSILWASLPASWHVLTGAVNECWWNGLLTTACQVVKGLQLMCCIKSKFPECCFGSWMSHKSEEGYFLWSYYVQVSDFRKSLYSLSLQKIFCLELDHSRKSSLVDASVTMCNPEHKSWMLASSLP